MTDQNTIQEKVADEQFTCPTPGCKSTTFQPSKMFQSHIRSDSSPYQPMVCVVCSAVAKVEQKRVSTPEEKTALKLILDEVHPLQSM